LRRTTRTRVDLGCRQRFRIAGADVPLVVAGDSAGGNLAAATVLRARDQGGPAVSMQILVYPVTDADLSYPSYETDENQRLVTRADMAWFWDQYLPDRARRSDPWASPMRAPRHIGLPPTLLISAEFDATRDDGEAYGEKLRRAGCGRPEQTVRRTNPRLFLVVDASGCG